jgi:hypothetical protein
MRIQSGCSRCPPVLYGLGVIHRKSSCSGPARTLNLVIFIFCHSLFEMAIRITTIKVLFSPCYKVRSRDIGGGNNVWCVNSGKLSFVHGSAGCTYAVVPSHREH